MDPLQKGDPFDLVRFEYIFYIWFGFFPRWILDFDFCDMRIVRHILDCNEIDCA